jgi:hypothetical protein
VWDNRGDGTFRAIEGHPLAASPNYTMGITIGDWDNAGDWSVYLSNMYSHAGNRVLRLTEGVRRETRAQLQVAAAGNQLFRRRAGTGAWQEEGEALGVKQADWAWASLFYDLDNDGDKELFVTNGNTSYREPDAPDY